MEIEHTGYLRTVDEVRETLELACIKEPELNNLTQILYSAQGSNVDVSMKLLELDEHLLETINKGDSLTFKGNKQDPVVLCTKNRTYDVKEAETSNSCLLVPDLKLFKQTNVQDSNRTIKACTISGIFHTYYEVRECNPKLEKLLSVLEPSSFKGLEYESGIDPESLYDWDSLRSAIQASQDELQQALSDYLIVNIDGYFRLISFECEVKSLTFMLDVFDENCWELNEVNREVTYNALKELVVEQVFDVLFKQYTELSEISKEDGTALYRYNEEKCCKTLAKVLLAASSVTEYDQFMESWSIGTPEKMNPKEEYLSGVALITWNSMAFKKEIVSFPEVDLPQGITERFNELFKAKDKWTVQEITPYITNLTTSKINVNSLLTKYTRCSVVNGIKYYSSKHGK